MEFLYVASALLVGFIAGDLLGARTVAAIKSELAKLKNDVVSAIQAEVKKL